MPPIPRFAASVLKPLQSLCSGTAPKAGPDSDLKSMEPNHHAENAKLLARVRAGDEAARMELAERNIGLVIHTASQIVRGDWLAGPARWQRREELIEQGLPCSMSRVRVGRACTA